MRERDQKLTGQQSFPRTDLDNIFSDVLVQKLYQIFPPLMMVWDLVN